MDAREFTKKRRKSGTAASVAEPSSTNAPNAREFTKQRRESGVRTVYTPAEQRIPSQDEQRSRTRQNLAYRAKVRAYEEAYTDYLNTPKYASPKLEEENTGAKQGGSDALSIPIIPKESAMLWQNDKHDGTTTLTDGFSKRKYVRMMGYDLDAAKARLVKLDEQSKSASFNIPKAPTDYAGTEHGIIKTNGRKENEEERQRLQKEIGEVEAYRKAVHYADLPDNADFEEKSARGSGAASDAVYFDYSSRADELDRAHRAEYDAILRDYGEEEANKYLYTQFGTPTNAYKQDFLEELTDDERKTFNYLLNTEGEKSAEEFLHFMQGNLNARAAYRDYANAKHDGFMGGAADMLSALSFGVGQAVSGVKNIFNDEADDVTYAEIKNALTRKGRVDRAKTDAGKWIAGASYDLATTAGNMLPSIAIGMVNPTAGTIAFSASAGGNYKQEALRAGYTAEQATQYGILAGASEGVLEKVLGGIVHVGGGALGNLASQGMTKISNVLAKCSVNGEIALRLGAKYLGNMGGEFADEYLQEILNPVFRNICLDEHNQFKPFTEEALYAGILGALNAGLLNLTALPGMYAESREETGANKFRYYIGGVASPDVVGEISMPGAPSDTSAAGGADATGAVSAEQIVTILEDSGVDTDTAEKMAPDLQTAISEIKAKEAADTSLDVTEEGNAQEPQTNTTDALRAAAREMLAEEAAKADMGRKLVTMDKWYEQPQTETAAQQPAVLPAASPSPAPEAAEPSTKRSGPATVTKYESFNSRRYSDPWVALVGKNGRLDFSQKIGGYTGGYRTGDAGELYITNPQENQIYAYGQKDYRGNTGGYRYVQYKNGEFVEVKKDELTEKLAEMQESNPQAVTQTRTDAVRESAATLGKTGERVLNEMYNPETNARDYVYGMMAYYNAGKNGTPMEQVKASLVLTDTMREAAYLAGQMDAGAAQSASGREVQPSAADENIPLAKQDTAAYNGSIAEHLTSNTEDIEHGTESVEEVSDGGRVQQSDAGGKDAGEVLGGVPAGDVRRDEGGRNAVQAPVGERQSDIRDAGADGVAGDAGVGSAGVRERGTVQPAAGEVSGRENNHAEKAHDAGGSQAGDAGSVKANENAGRASGSGKSKKEQRIQDKAVRDGGLGREVGLATESDSQKATPAYAPFAQGVTTAPAGSFTAKQAEKARGYGIPCFVIQDDVYDAAKGAHHDVPAFAYRGQIYLRATISPEWQDVSISDHEAVHAMRQIEYKPYLEFLKQTPDYFNFHSPDAHKIFDMISAHVGVEISDMNEKQRTLFYDEINAAMHGHIANGDTEALRAEYGDAFVDFNAYVKELSTVFNGFVDSNGQHDAAGTEAQAKTTPQEIAAKTEQAAQENPRGSNLVITEKSKFPTTPKTRFKANVEAIQVLRTLMQENRYATQAEQEILAKYTGWGGLSNAFDGKNGFDAEARQLQALLDDAEYKAARASILDAYYTAPGIINAMYNGLEKLGFAGGRMLEPSAGVGRFIGAMPQALSGKVKSWTAVELDKVTGSIAKYLYPNADVRVMGFENAKIPDSYMDAVVGNVPFGNISVADKRYPAAVTRSIHNYFIAKALDKVRPGGVLCVITSSGTLEAAQPGAREYFMKQADLIGAIRLPNTAFEGTGTDVVSDILIFKKREPGTPYKGEVFATIGYRPWNDANHWGNYDINEYFVNHPEMVLGTPTYTTGQYGRSTLTFNPLESRYSLQTQIERAFGKINARMDYPAKPSAEETNAAVREASGKAKDGTIVKQNGKIYVAQDGALRETGASASDTEKLSAYVAVRDAAHELRQLQLEGAADSKIQTARDTLNKAYDDFVKKYGYLNAPKNRKLIRADADCYSTLALEDYNDEKKVGTKTDIFTKNTIVPNKVITHTDTIEDAIAVSMNETGAVEPARIAALVGQSDDVVTKDMLRRGLVFKNRDGELETAASYLSGNVRAKLRDAEALAEGDPSYDQNVEALRAVVPADIPADEIAVRPGATWIPDSVYSEFASHMLGGARKDAVVIKYNRALGSFSIDLRYPYLRTRSENNTTWGTNEVPFIGGRQSILNAALNNKSINVWKADGEKRVLDVQATAAAQEKLEKVLAEFQSWMWSDETRRRELGTLYNDIFNATVRPKYDGAGFTVAGMNPDMHMYEHQVKAAEFAIYGGNTLLAHRVGAGKTFEMAAIAMKLRQLGVVKKPAFVVPKHLVPQWGSEFMKYFPAAKLLVLEQSDFTPANRKTFMNRIATGDYDAVIMSYEQFGAVPMSAENQEAFYQAQIDALEDAISESKRGGRDPSLRDMERSKKALEAKLKKLGDIKRDDGNTAFEELGVDALFVDEAHNFKNLFYSTKMNGVSDLGDKEGSQRAFDLYMKVRWLQKLNGGRGVVFATATPIMNSVVELYTMQRYLQGDKLDAMGLSDFDAYVNQFGEVKTVRKMKVGGNGYDLRQSLAKYKNTAELQQLFRSFADVIVDAEELPWLKIPKMKGGKRIVVECEPSEFQHTFMQELGKRSEALRGAGKGGKEDHIFKIFDDGKKISYTQRMIDPSLPYEDGGKVMKCVENVYRIWEETKDDRMTQLIFCDRGTPDGAESAKGVNLYADIKNMLVGKGVPANEIAFIHEAVNEKQKDRLFEAVRNGDVRVLIGSTAKMGTGMNVQDRITALHELNAPDRPGDLEQNEGRALRQGNINDEVGVYVYITKETFDSRQWDALSRKNTFIHQMMKGEYSGREAVGDGELTLSAAEISAIASGNPLIMEQFEVSEKVKNLENLERAHRKEVALAKDRIEDAKKKIAADTDNLSKYNADIKVREDTAGDKFSMTVGGKRYTERKSAGKALIAAAKKHLDVGSTTETYTAVGSFAGFDLYVTNKGDMVLRGAAQYRGTVNMQSAAGTIQALEAIPKRLDALRAGAETRITENKADIPKLEKAAAAPFDKADELVAARVREAQIMEQLNPSSEPEPEVFDDDSDGDGIEMRRESPAGGDTKAAMTSDSREAQWQADRVGEDKQPMRLDELIEKIRHDFEVNITKGHVRGAGVTGQYNTRDKGIRVRSANDLPTALHELGHHLDNSYKILKNAPKDAMKELADNFGEDNKSAYPRSEWEQEGFAEYVRKFMQNRETAAIDYPAFTKHFLSSFAGNDLAKIEQLADEVNAYYALDTDSAASSIRLREEKMPDARTFDEKIKAKSDALYQAWVDSLNGIKRFDRATGANTYILASNSAYADAVAGNILIGDLTDANGQYVAPGLTTALQGVNVKNKEEYRAFGEYLVVRHGPERLKEGMRVFADDRKNSTAFMNRREAELAKQYPEFEAAADRLYEFQRQFLDTWGVDTGLISEETAQSWAARWQYYVPFNRAVGDKAGIGAKRGFANQNSTIKRAHGSGLDVLHPVDNIINNIVKMVNAGIRNNVMREITDAAQKLGANAEWMEKVPTPMRANKASLVGVKGWLHEQFSGSEMDDAGIDEALDIIGQLDDILVQYRRGKAFGDVVTVLKDGKPEFWKINDPMLLASLTNLAPPKMKGILDAYAVVSRFITGNITGNNLVWSLFSNFPRDLGTLFTYSKVKNPLRVLSSMGSAYVNAFKGKNASPYYREYLAMGGGKTSAYTADKDLAKKVREKMMRKKIDVNPLDWISFMSDLIELGPRFATYKMMRENGMTPQEAFYESTDVTVNFRRGGIVSREINKVIPFFNASVQGLDKFGRWITAADAPKGYRMKVIRGRIPIYLIAGAVIGALIYGINNADDDKEEDYQQLSNYTKNSYWCIPIGDGKYFAIPKPRELAVWSSLCETAMEYGIGENDHAFDGFYDYATNAFLPSVASDFAKGDWQCALGSLGIIGTGAYMMANRDFLGRPIESAGMQYLEPKDRYNERTSKIAYWVGQATDSSPQMIDYFFGNVLGGFWKAQKALFPVGGESVDYTLGVYNTYIKDNQYSTDLTNWLYDKAEKSSQASKSDPKNLDKEIVAKTDDCMREFYGNYNKLAKNLASSAATRGTRQTVLSMINEYRKASDSGAQTDAQKAVYAVCAAVGDTSLLPAVMPVVVKDGQKGEHELGAVQYVEYQLEYNRFYWEYAEDVLGGLTDYADKIRALKSAKTIAKERATSNVLARIGAPKTKFDEKYGDISGITDVDIVKFRAGIDLANDDGGLTQEEVEDILDDMKLSKEAKQKLWQAANSKWSEWNNPYR